MKRSRVFLFGQALALLVAMLPFVPVIPGAATYEGVGPAAGHTIGRRVPGTERFLLMRGRLYLLRQRTWRALVLVTLIRDVQWREADLQKLHNRFPELVDGSW